MKQRTDKEVLGFISSDLKERYSWISDVSYPDYEDYKIDLTLDSEYGEYPVEVKTSRVHRIKTIFGGWNDYYRTDNRDGILRFSTFSCVPKTPEDIENINYEDIDWSFKGMPKEIVGKHVYFLNASTKKGSGISLLNPSCKFCQMIKNSGILIYLSKGGYLVWDNKALGDSFLGFCWTRCYHTEDFRTDNKQDIELKALFSFEGAKWVKADVPDEIFN